jgi:hypothetical protein
MNKFLGTALSGCIAISLIALASSPASAWTNTRSDLFDVALPGQKPHTEYDFENRLDVNDSDSIPPKTHAESVMWWQVLDGVVKDDSTRFTSFTITTRLEYRTDKAAADNVVTSQTCDWTKIVNEYAAWHTEDTTNTCATQNETYLKGLYWSADSTVVYDIKGDGKGAITKELAGSPLAHD